LSDFSYSEWIQENCWRLRLTQSKLAKMVGTSRQAVGQWWHGKTAPSQESVDKLDIIFSAGMGDSYEAPLVLAVEDAKQGHEGVQEAAGGVSGGSEGKGSWKPPARVSYGNLREVVQGGELELVSDGKGGYVWAKKGEPDG
jgi:transcriptional regulator with XRE-family HTH domain